MPPQELLEKAEVNLLGVWHNLSTLFILPTFFYILYEVERENCGGSVSRRLCRQKGYVCLCMQGNTLFIN